MRENEEDYDYMTIQISLVNSQCLIFLLFCLKGGTCLDSGNILRA